MSKNAAYIPVSCSLRLNDVVAEGVVTQTLAARLTFARTEYGHRNVVV